MQTTDTINEPFTVMETDAKRRLPIALIASVVTNVLFLFVASATTRETPLPLGEDKTVYLTLDPIRPEVPKVAKPEPRVRATPTPKPPPAPVATPTPPIPRVRPTPEPIPAPARQQAARKVPSAPQDSHNAVLAAKSSGAPKPDDFVVRAGGNARSGQVMTRQGDGSGTVNTPAPVPPPDKKTEAPPEPRPVATASVPAPPSPPRPTPTPEPTPTPKPVGPTRDAEPAKQELPSIPDELKDNDFKSFVRVKVEVAEDGAFTVVLRTSSGNAEVDRRVLDALKRWKWKPALKNGEAVASTQLFKFEFEVN